MSTIVSTPPSYIRTRIDSYIREAQPKAAAIADDGTLNGLYHGGLVVLTQQRLVMLLEKLSRNGDAFEAELRPIALLPEEGGAE